MHVNFPLFAWHVYHVEGSLSVYDSLRTLVLSVDQVLTLLQTRMYSYLHMNHHNDNLSIFKYREEKI